MKAFKIIILLSLFSSATFAGGGSLYTRWGIGNLQVDYSARKLGLGGSGIALVDYTYLNTLNPAGWYKLNQTRIAAGINFSGLNISDGTNDAFYTDGSVTGFTMGFPIQRDYGLTLVAGLVPYSNVEYEVVDQRTDPIGGDYSMNLSGTGGLSKIFVGSSVILPFDIAFGAAFELYTGKIEFNSSIDFPADNTNRDALYTKAYKYEGTGANFGLLSGNLSDLIGIEEVTDLRLALTYNLATNLDTDTSLTSNSSIGETVINSALVNTHIPERLGVGLSFQYNRDYLFLIDYIYQPWSNYKMNGLTSTKMKDMQRYSFGFEYQNHDRRIRSYWDEIRWRGGLSYEETQYIMNGEDINQFSIHAGFSLPFGFGNTVDFGFQYGFRGTTDSNLLKENIFNFSVSLSMGEFWFVRQER